jgi:hypothetical protein
LHYSLGVVAKNGTEYYLKDDIVTQMSNGTVSGANNCANIGYPAPGVSYGGYDFSTSTFWAAWTQ